MLRFKGEGISQGKKEGKHYCFQQNGDLEGAETRLPQISGDAG